MTQPQAYDPKPTPKPNMILQYFKYDHLPEALQDVSQPFCELAHILNDNLPRNAETSTALRKLLEAKDCAVRAVIHQQ